MSQNLSWTSALGDAYHSYPHDVMAAIQTMRQTAENSGNLKTTSQQTVANQGGTIVIEPANPQVVYVPTYSPAVYGAYAPPPYPGYSGWDMAAASAISFGAGMAVGAAWDHAWGWNSWGTSWHGGNVTYNHNTYISNTNNFRNQYNQFRGADSYNRSSFQGQTGEFNRASNFSGASSSHNWQSAESRGYFSGDKPSSGLNSGSFSDFRDGGFAHDDSFRGQSSFGGFDRSGGFGGGGFDRGGFGGGGFRGGGRR
jgi:hypothetical protein